MAKNCESCEDLRTQAPDFAMNGVTDKVCASLKNNTGLDASNGNDDCTDLHNANDCLVGNMEDEVEAYDVCEWKPFMKRFIPNLYNTLKAMICAICGLWSNVEKLWCYMNNITKRKTIQVDKSYMRLADGVKIVEGETLGKLYTPVISGNQFAAYVTGTLELSGQWVGHQGAFGTGGAGWLVYEWQIPKDKFDLQYAWQGNFQNGQTPHIFDGHIAVFFEGQKAWGWKAADDSGTHVVKDGYIYIQMRATQSDKIVNKQHVTPCGVIPILLDASADCK